MPTPCNVQFRLRGKPLRGVEQGKNLPHGFAAIRNYGAHIGCFLSRWDLGPPKGSADVKYCLWNMTSSASYPSSQKCPEDIQLCHFDGLTSAVTKRLVHCQKI